LLEAEENLTCLLVKTYVASTLGSFSLLAKLQMEVCFFHHELVGDSSWSVLAPVDGTSTSMLELA
jgi:hypothetical protein